MRTDRVFSVLAAILLASGCAQGGLADGGPPIGDGGRVDSGTGIDSGPNFDAGPRPDSGGRIDSGTTPIDSGTTPIDSGTTPIDAGTDGGGMVDPACMAAVASYRWGFEGSATGWTTSVMDGVSGSWPFNPWAFGNSTAGPICPEGMDCIGTEIGDNYIQCQRADIRTPPVDLSACAGSSVALVFEHNYEIWTGSYGGSTWYDGGIVEVSTDGGSSWLPVDSTVYSGTIAINPNRGASYACINSTGFYVHGMPGYVGSSGGWVTAEILLPAAAIGSANVMARFAFASGVSSSTTDPEASRAGTERGWYIDDVRFEAR